METNELETLSIDELYIYKKYLIGEIKKLKEVEND